MKKKTIIILLLAFSLISPVALSALSTGEKVSNPLLRDAENKPVKIPFMGKKNLLLFYIDPDVHEQNDAFIKKLSEEIKSPPDFLTIAIINLKDAPLKPNSIIRYMIRREMQKTGGTILTDPGRTLRKEWALGECNDHFVVILLDTSQKVRFIKKGKLDTAETKEVLDLIKDLTSDAKSDRKVIRKAAR